MLSTDSVYLLGQTASYCIVFYIIVFRGSTYNMYIITISVKQSGKQCNTTRKPPKMSERARTRTHAHTYPHIISSCSRQTRRTNSARAMPR